MYNIYQNYVILLVSNKILGAPSPSTPMFFVSRLDNFLHTKKHRCTGKSIPCFPKVDWISLTYIY